METTFFIATKALIVYDGKVLLIRESSKNPVGTNPNRFDVVGGRMEHGERFDECLLREIKEETGLDVRIGKPFFVSEWRPVVNGNQWQIVGIFFECHADSNTVTLSADHDEYKWIDPSLHMNENLIPTLIPVFEAYVRK